MKIIKDYSNVCSHIQFNIPEKRGKKYFCPISIEDSPLCIQTTKLQISNIDRKENFVVADLILSSDLYDFFKSIEQLAIETCFTNSSLWFKGKTFSQKHIENSFKSSINNDDMTLKVYTPLTDDKVNIELYDQYNNSLEFDEELLYNSENIVILYISGIWLSSHHIGLAINIAQIKSYKKKFKLSGCQIDDDDSDISDYPSDIDEDDFNDKDDAFFDELIADNEIDFISDDEI